MAGAGYQDSQGRGRLGWQTKSFLPREFHGHLARCRPDIVAIVRDGKNRVATTGGPHTPSTIWLSCFAESRPAETFKPMPHMVGRHANPVKKRGEHQDQGHSRHPATGSANSTRPGAPQTEGEAQVLLR
jgi:hypothetical protein